MVSSLSRLQRLIFFAPLSDAEHMAVGMSHVHFAHVPRHIRRGPGHLDALREALFVDGIHVLHPPAHPAALILRLVVERCERARVRSFAACRILSGHPRATTPSSPAW